jgi:pentatricopeptide repeat protein
MVLGINNYNKLDKSHIYTGEEDFKDSFLKLPGNSMVIVSYLYFHYKYYQDILGLKKDVTLLGYGEILYPKLFSLIDKDKYQDVKEIDYDVDITNTAKVMKFINLNFKNYDRIFTETISEFRGMNRFIKYYDGFLFEFTKSKIEKIGNEEISKINDYFSSIVTRFVLDYDYKNDNEADMIYVQDFIFCIDYLLHYGHLNNVLYMADTMFKVFGSDFRDNLLDVNKDSLNVLSGVAYIKKSDFDKAESVFKDMIKNDEYKAEAYNKLGFIYKYKKEYYKAIAYYNLAMKENPYLMENYIEIGDIYELLGEDDKAGEIYNQGIKYLFQDEKRILIQKIENLGK